MRYRNPRGGSWFGIILAYAIGGIIGVGIACLLGWICGCGTSGPLGSGSSCGSATPVTLSANQCQTPPNACGLVGIGNGSYSCPSGYTCNSPIDGKNGCTSGDPTNACYQTDSSGEYVTDSKGEFVTTDAVGSCDAAVPSNTNCACTSSANVCGQTSTGFLDEAGSCAAAPPPNSNCACTSPANACGQTNTGFLNQAGSCNASAPPNSSCPPPNIPTDGFTASPSTMGLNGKTTLTWRTTNSTSCTVTGDNGLNQSGGASGSVQVTGLNQTTAFTLTCEDGTGGPTASKSLRVIVDPHYKEL